MVEGTGDQRALTPFVASGVMVIPADGKEQVIAAFDALEAHLRGAVVFVIDCDGNTDSRLKGHRDLILTANRDVEADLLFELGAFDRVAHELLAPISHDRADVDRKADAVLALATRFARRFTIVIEVARDRNLPCKPLDQQTRRRRKLRAHDLADIGAWVREDLDLHAAVSDLRGLIGWSVADARAVELGATAALASPCATHGRVDCCCGNNRLCNGHHLVGGIQAALSREHGILISDAELDRALRIGADRDRLKEWIVVARAEAWEAASGRPVLQRT